MKPIMFFMDTIEIRPHSASDEKHLDKIISLGDFAAGEGVSLYTTENGEYLCRTNTRPFGANRFIEGPEVTYE